MPLSACLAEISRLHLHICLKQQRWGQLGRAVRTACWQDDTLATQPRQKTVGGLHLVTSQRRCTSHVAALASISEVGSSDTGQAPDMDEGSRLPHIIQTKGVPIHLYADPADVESEALQQLHRVAESALPVGYISAMPDVHLGKGVTIGTVFASEEFVCPNAVGVDIGCGMCAVPVDGLHKDDLSLEQKVKIQGLVKRRIPTGFNMHTGARPGMRAVLDDISHRRVPTKYLEGMASQKRAEQQLGTLGGGNHFLEVLHDENDRVWIMLHSGSRNIGNQTAQHYDSKAKEYIAQLGLGEVHGLNYLRIDSQDGQDYLNDMTWCQAYAFQNRAAMLADMIECVEEI
mmetsp:Transcript_496/g.1474  ORF Transcript_496/g.1474 Transcript_496/m.1474 type:complete len:344 (+) Transcript_496:155-1186(+)